MNITAPSFDEDEIRLLRRCLGSHWVTQGPLTAEFERLVAARHQAPYALATTSCTAALHLATLALGLRPGDEVVVPAFTWVTSANCAEYVGAKAVFADVDPRTFNVDPDSLAAALTPRTRAVVAVHLFGLAAPMDEIMALARKHGFSVIEDAACAIGTTYRGRPVGAIGDIGCFSFHPRKVITTGEGGMVTTAREDLAARVRSLRNHGATGLPPGMDPSRPYAMGTFDMLGYNLRLSDIQAAVGIAQMGKLERLLRERRWRAERYSALLSGFEQFVLPTSGAEEGGHTYQSYVIRLAEGGRSRRNVIMDYLGAKDIQTRPGTHAVHRLGYYTRKYGIEAGQFPNACVCEDTTITLPLFPGMTDSEQERVVSVLHEAVRS
jgi:dTDP-4-amino-4,6-dideoxygalactose transaminase